MADENGDAPKEKTHPCPICKQEGDNVLLLKEDNVIQKPLTKIQQSSILSLPKAIEMLILTTDLYICRTCGGRYEKIKSEKTTMAAVQYADEHGRPIDPSQMGPAR